jgi:serine/threonine-protein kinase
MVTGNGIEPKDGQRRSEEKETADPLRGRVLNNRFTLLGAIGGGGMGTVYQAVQSPLERVVAIKVLNPKHANAQDPGFRQRFLLEASLSSKLRHPNTITVFDYGETADGVFYIVMEYLEGEPLSRLVGRIGPLPWTRCLHIGQQVCRSLREAHKLGIVHRDLKPANVMLLTEDHEDRVKVLDFGLVKSFLQDPSSSHPDISDAGMLLGSPTYMAPEQARSHADHRSDIYSLGVVLYQMLVGRPPFVANDAIDVIFKHLNEPPPPMRSIRPELEFGRDVEDLVLKCLEKQPSWRFQSMDDVLEAMRRVGVSSTNSPFVGGDPSERQAAPGSSPAQASLSESSAEDSLGIEISVVPGTLRAWAGKRKLLAGSVFLASVLIAFLATIAASRSSRSQTARFRSAQAVVLEPQQQQPLPATGPSVRNEPARKLVRFHISTDPRGALVSIKGRNMGRTPLSFELPGGDAGSASAELTLSLKGYHPMTVIAGGSGPDLVLTEKMQRKVNDRPVMAANREAPPKQVASPPDAEPKVSEEQPFARQAAVAPASAAPNVAPEQSPGGGATAAAVSSLPIGSGGSGEAPESPPSRIQLDESKVRLTKISGPDPEYTPEAIQREVQGTMVVNCVITVEGAVRNCRVIKGLPFMDRAVVHALERRKYQAYLSNNQPVEVDYTFKIRLAPPY